MCLHERELGYLLASFIRNPYDHGGPYAAGAASTASAVSQPSNPRADDLRADPRGDRWRKGRRYGLGRWGVLPRHASHGSIAGIRRMSYHRANG
jgi:hypothetical protein